MTCDEFNAAAWRARGPTGSRQMVEAMHAHSLTCEPCSRVFMMLIKYETEKSLRLPVTPVDPTNKESDKQRGEPHDPGRGNDQ